MAAERGIVKLLWSSDTTKQSAMTSYQDKFYISAELQRRLENAHRLRFHMLVTSICYRTDPTIVCMMNHSMDDALLLYRQLFYCTFEAQPEYCPTTQMLAYIAQSPLISMPVIVDFGGAFETEHLHRIACAFPNAEIYSVDVLYQDLDLLLCNINNDESKWCIIPVFDSTPESEQYDLINCLRHELRGNPSVWKGITITELNFVMKVNRLQVYDPYAEVAGLKNIHFVDSLDKCDIKPCLIFMAFQTYQSTPSEDYLVRNGFLQPSLSAFISNSGVDFERSMSAFITNSGVDFERSLSETFIKNWGIPFTTSVYKKICGGSHKEFYAIVNDNHMNFNYADTALAQLTSIVGERKQVHDLIPHTSIREWADRNEVLRILNEQFNPYLKSIGDIRGTDIFHRQRCSLWSYNSNTIDFIDLDLLIVEHNFETLTATVVQQFIEEHLSSLWKDPKSDHGENSTFATKFTTECLEELFGTITNLHVHIDSKDVLQQSIEFIEQLKLKNPTFHIEFSIVDSIQPPIGSEIILVFECNENYILTHTDVNAFLKYIVDCSSLQEIQTKLAESVCFSYIISRGQPIIWRHDLSSVYSTSTDLSIRQIEDALMSHGLKDIKVVIKRLRYLNNYELPKYRKNQAIIQFSKSFVDISKLPKAHGELQQWMHDQEECKLTGPFITIFPNESKNPIDYYPKESPKSKVGYAYCQVCESKLVLYQWKFSPYQRT
ncbi:unnamed protein product [Rotaria magnacalcarata]|uniref:Uncharacterized protein n=2 Tax=Rotaria magnacalcarata TaxID=392030 RepID=A0A816A479_9BILA|nr:unnamed protein product [Rotaria magnacalcarata]CAF1591834.1 unnamed protein product [Rotaria magnacalcarata]CAF2061222.1 unnamed protein product [Rotaria magnacalcarata]CAF3792603.1 unnamed protein product [Rotaria magnacalcarata]CAF3801306.1 unnamed protein product [Rotaria magnacalcarata]